MYRGTRYTILIGPAGQNLSAGHILPSGLPSDLPSGFPAGFPAVRALDARIEKCHTLEAASCPGAHRRGQDDAHLGSRRFFYVLGHLRLKNAMSRHRKRSFPSAGSWSFVFEKPKAKEGATWSVAQGCASFILFKTFYSFIIMIHGHEKPHFQS